MEKLAFSRVVNEVRPIKVTTSTLYSIRSLLFTVPTNEDVTVWEGAE